MSFWEFLALGWGGLLTLVLIGAGLAMVEQKYGLLSSRILWGLFMTLLFYGGWKLAGSITKGPGEGA